MAVRHLGFAFASLLMVGACTPQRTNEDAATPATCRPTKSNVTWTERRNAPFITDAFRINRDTMDVGEKVFDEPFQPGFDSPDIPQSWLPVLAALLAESGPEVTVNPPPEPTSGRIGFSYPDVPELINFDGVNVVHQGFEVDCGDDVRGAFQGWTTMVGGIVACEPPRSTFTEIEIEALGFCSTVPTELPSGSVPPAEQFETPPS